MKICVIGTRGFPNIEGGVEKHCEKLYSILCTKHDFIVYRRRPYVVEANNSNKRINFIDLPSTKIKGFESFFHSFISTISAIRQKPDIIHYHNIGPALFSFLINKNIKIVLTYHSANYEHNKWGLIAKKILKLSEQIAINRADKIIIVNNKLKDKFSKKIQNKCIYIPNGVSSPTLTKSKSILSKYEIIPNKYILSVGRIVPEKGFDVLINAYKDLLNNDFKLIIVGNIDEKDKYYNYLKSISNQNIVFTGLLVGEDLSQMYQNAALFVLASRNESSPIVLLEAMSYGLDILVSNISNLEEYDYLIKDNYFESDNSYDLMSKIKNKIEGKETTKHTYDLKEYNWDNISMKTDNVYKAVMKND